MSTFGSAARRFLSTSVAAHTRKTVVYGNGVVVSWHPQESIPYEQTKEIRLEKKKEERSVLAASVRDPALRLKKGPSNDELKEIFYTDKNEWFTRTREDRLRSVAGPRAKRH